MNEAKEQAGKAARDYMARYGITVRELAYELGIGKSQAGELVQGGGSGPAMAALARLEAEGWPVPQDAWGPSQRRSLRELLAEYEHEPDVYWEGWTAVSVNAAERAGQPGAKVDKPIRRLLLQALALWREEG